MVFLAYFQIDRPSLAFKHSKPIVFIGFMNNPGLGRSIEKYIYVEKLIPLSSSFDKQI